MLADFLHLYPGPALRIERHDDRPDADFAAEFSGIQNVERLGTIWLRQLPLHVLDRCDHRG